MICREKREIVKYLFICSNTRENRESCGALDAEVLIKNLKNRLKEDLLWEKFKVARTGCLGPCAFGITALMFPENELLTKITLDDEDELYELLTSQA